MIRGSFYPFGDGAGYTYAMYYVTISFQYSVNQIFAAFSNDGVTWRKWGSPVLTASNPDPTKECYGIGSPSTYNINNLSHIRLFYHKACNGGFSIHSVGTADGVTFAAPTTVAQSSGLSSCQTTGGSPPWPGGIPTTANFAFDSVNSKWYAVMDLGCDNNQRPNQRGTVGFRLVSTTGTATGSLASATWTELATINTNLTGSEINSWPAIGRNQFGNIPSQLNVAPTIQMFYSTSAKAPVNGSAVQGAAAAEPQYWDLAASTVILANRRVTSLMRYNGSQGHYVTTGYVDTAVYTVNEGSQGLLAEAPTTAMTVPLFNCSVYGTYNVFTSNDALCEGQRIIGLQGYASPTGGSLYYPLYRCRVAATGDHFVSHAPACEGQITEGSGPMGYALKT